MSAPSAQDLAVCLPILAVLCAAMLILVADWFLPAGDMRAPVALSLVGLGVAGWLIFSAWGGTAVLAFAHKGAANGDGQMVGLLRQDGLALFAQALLVLVAALTVLMSFDYVKVRGIAMAEYFVLILLATAGMMLLVLANDLILLFLALELFSIALYILAGFVRGDRFSQEAALKYFVTGAFAAGFLLYGIALLYAATGTTNLDVLGTYLASHVESLPALTVVAFGLILVGLGFKVAMAPFHQWTPDVYEGAPSTVTAFMAAGTKTAAFVALIRVLWTAFPAFSAQWLPLLAMLAVLTMVLGNLAALVQGNLKRLLAYSAIAHAGYLLVAVVAAQPVAITLTDVQASALGKGAIGGAAFQSPGMAAALFYLFVYALLNLGAFAVLVGMGPVPDEQGGLRDASRLTDLNGLAGRHPGLAVAMALFLLGLTGLPPTAGFLGKWYIFQAAVGAGWSWLAVAVILNSVVSAFYYLRPIVYMTMAEPASDAPISVPTGGAIVVAMTAVVVGLAILLSGPVVGAALTAATQLGGAGVAAETAGR